MRRRATAVGALILVFVMAGTALAASRGNAWRLGYVETLNAYVTGITGIHTAELLRIANTNGSSGARAIRAESKGSGAGTIYAKNTGGGPAAEFVTNAGRAPFKVNRTSKVANLNADFVDGKSAGAFAPSVLAAGQTLTGLYGAWGTGGGYLEDSINYRIPLASAIPGANAHYRASGSAATAECPGPGGAAAGHLCVYEVGAGARSGGFIYDPWAGSSASAPAVGFGIYFNATGTGGSWSYGSWAVTAPTVATLSSSGSEAPASGPRVPEAP